MSIPTQRFARKILYVEAIEVTAENMEEVAEWCGGEIFVAAEGDKSDYIKVDVLRPTKPRHTQAYVGDWILKTKAGFKVYLPKAFSHAFVPAEDTEKKAKITTN